MLRNIYAKGIGGISTIIHKNRRRIRFDPLLRHRRDTLEEQARQESYFIPVAYLVNVQLIACFGHTPIILLWVYVKNAERCQTLKVDTEDIVSVKNSHVSSQVWGLAPEL